MSDLGDIVAANLAIAWDMLPDSLVTASFCTGAGTFDVSVLQVPLSFERGSSNIRFGMKKWLARVSDIPGGNTFERGQMVEIGADRFDIEDATLDPTGTVWTIYVAPPDVAGALWRREFAIPADTWNWTHNLGYVPVVQVYDSDWNEMISPVVNVDENSVQVQHTFAATGWIVLVTNGV